MDEPEPGEKPSRRRSTSTTTTEETIRPLLDRLESLHGLLQTRDRETLALTDQLRRTLALTENLVNNLDERLETLADAELALHDLHARMEAALKVLNYETSRLRALPSREPARDSARR